MEPRSYAWSMTSRRSASSARRAADGRCSRSPYTRSAAASNDDPPSTRRSHRDARRTLSGADSGGSPGCDDGREDLRGDVTSPTRRARPRQGRRGAARRRRRTRPICTSRPGTRPPPRIASPRRTSQGRRAGSGARPHRGGRRRRRLPRVSAAGTGRPACTAPRGPARGGTSRATSTTGTASGTSAPAGGGAPTIPTAWAARYSNNAATTGVGSQAYNPEFRRPLSSTTSGPRGPTATSNV